VALQEIQIPKEINHLDTPRYEVEHREAQRASIFCHIQAPQESILPEGRSCRNQEKHHIFSRCYPIRLKMIIFALIKN